MTNTEAFESGDIVRAVIRGSETSQVTYRLDELVRPGMWLSTCRETGVTLYQGEAWMAHDAHRGQA